MAKTIYLNLEDDVAKVVAKLKREAGAEAVLVFPKKSFIFSDSINLRLLKKQVDMLQKKAFILTMDERGQNYAQEAGFELKRMPTKTQSNSFSDIRPRTARVPQSVAAAEAIAIDDGLPVVAHVFQREVFLEVALRLGDEHVCNSAATHAEQLAAHGAVLVRQVGHQW